MNLFEARNNMIQAQVRANDVRDERILQVMRSVPREDFVPEDLVHLAYADFRIPLAHDQAMMTPREEGIICEQLALKATDKVLEVGTGTGYFTCMLAHLAGAVHSVEYFESLAKGAQARIQSTDVAQKIVLDTKDAFDLSADMDNFDVIVLTGAVLKVPELFKRHLNEGGRIFAVVGQAPSMHGICMTKQGSVFQSQVMYDTKLPYLISPNPQNIFEF